MSVNKTDNKSQEVNDLSDAQIENAYKQYTTGKVIDLSPVTISHPEPPIVMAMPVDKKETKTKQKKQDMEKVNESTTTTLSANDLSDAEIKRVLGQFLKGSPDQTKLATIKLASSFSDGKTMVRQEFDALFRRVFGLNEGYGVTGEQIERAYQQYTTGKFIPEPRPVIVGSMAGCQRVTGGSRALFEKYGVKLSQEAIDIHGFSGIY